jgi:hypothetical protein
MLHPRAVLLRTAAVQQQAAEAQVLEREVDSAPQQSVPVLRRSTSAEA